MPQLIGLGFMAVPVVIALVMVLIWRSHRRGARAIATAPPGWLTTTATVVDERNRFERSPTFEHNSVFVRTPVLRFRAADGRDVVAPSQVEGSLMPRPGAVVQAHYDPADPRRVRLAAESLPRSNAVASGVVWTLMCVPFAAVFGFFGYLLLRS